MRPPLPLSTWLALSVLILQASASSPRGWLAVPTAHAAPLPRAGAGRSSLSRSGGAKSLLEKALAALDERDLRAASRLLTEAYRQSPRSEVLYYLGCVARLEGRVLEAHDLFRRYLADPAREPDEAVTRKVEEFVAQPPPPSGSVTVLSDPGALVMVDGRLVGTLPLPLPLLLKPGFHKVGLEFMDKKLEAPVQALSGRLTELRISRASGTVLVSVLPAILLFAEPPNLPPEAGRLFDDALEQAARGEQYTMLRSELVLPQAPEIKDCLDQDRCRRQLAQKSSVDLLLERRVQATGTSRSMAWKIDLALLRTDVAAPAAVAKMSCGPCSAEQAAMRLKDAATKLLSDGLARPQGFLRISLEPAAAEVRVDGRVIAAKAPSRETLWTGAHEVTISHTGYVTKRHTIEVGDGQEVSLSVRLEKLQEAGKPLDLLAAGALPAASPSVQPQRARRPAWRLWLGGAMLGVGAGLAAASAVGVARSGQCVDPPEVEDGACPRLYSTGAIGGAGLGVGTAFLAAGIVLVALPAREQRAVAR